MANVMCRELNEDWRTTNTSVRKRIWAYRRGFFAKTALAYGLDDSNYRDYENDFHYYRLHPLNGRFSMWIDDKLTIKYLLQPFDDYLPKYYFQLRNGSVTKLMDCPKKLGPDVASVIRLLEQRKNLAMKPIAGSRGVGFLKLSSDRGKYRVNNGLVNVDELKAMLVKPQHRIITEYLSSHWSHPTMYPEIPNTLRVMTIRRDKNIATIVGAHLKLGTSLSGLAAVVADGAILAGVDLGTGSVFAGRTWKDGAFVNLSVHPDTGLPLPKRVPYWHHITAKVKEIGHYVPQLKYMGFDVVIGDQGWKIIEVNSHPGLHLVQLYYPMLRNEYATRLFYGE